MTHIGFRTSQPLSLGVELELQILATHDYDLTRGAPDLIALIDKRAHPGEVKLEITQSMIEACTGVHRDFRNLLGELRDIRDCIVGRADALNLAVSGGGTHPFQHWYERAIADTPRFQYLSDLYGYLAKQFTVFGQHVHVGCPHGDEALYLTHALSRYVPHFIALAASSPYYQGSDTAFDCSRLNTIYAFPLSGRAPFMLRWTEFEDYFAHMRGLGIVASMKDFYWDIRPKPEFGTIEVRVCDTPLNVDKAAAIAAYIQALCRFLMVERPRTPHEQDYLPYTYNRFQACRFGIEGNFVDPAGGEHRSLRSDILESFDRVAQHARELDASAALHYLARTLDESGNDSHWIRSVFAESRSLNELMRRQAARWRENDPQLEA